MSYVDVPDRERVAEAAARMDKVKPDWWQHIDPLRLDLSKSCDCICGQNGLNWEATLDEGFVGGVFSGRPWEPLWLEEIARRMPDSVPAEPAAPLVVSSTPAREGAQSAKNADGAPAEGQA